ncbi:MAG: tryptophan halogenase family protein [Pseudomonadota bacterium]
MVGSAQPLKVVIVGGGTAGWMTAAALSSVFGRSQSVCLVESAEIGTVGVGEATLPHIRFFNKRLGINESELMERTQATFKLGIEFCNWGRLGDSYIHPFGAFGGKPLGLPFHQFWLRRHLAGDQTPIENYSLPIVASRRGKFALPSEDPASLMAMFGYAFQFDASLYAAYLREFAERCGVTRIEGTVVDVRQDGESGFIRSIKLASGEEIAGDLFIDCSGFRGLLIEQTLRTGYDEWTKWLPCDRAMAMPSANVGPLFPYTRATAQEAGWQWRIPLQHRTGNGYVYSSQFISDDEAAMKLKSRVEGEALGEPRPLRFTAGRRRLTWNKNCIAIGLAGGFLEPLESTSIYLIQIAITTLIDNMPERMPFDLRAVDAYNRWIEMEYDRVRDFLILHYHATERDDAPMWRYVRHMEIPDSLQHKMELFRRRGNVVTYKDGLFLEPSWVAVYLGQRVNPTGYDPLADRLSDADLDLYARETEAAISAEVDKMPDHASFLRSYCPGYLGKAQRAAS